MASIVFVTHFSISISTDSTSIFRAVGILSEPRKYTRMGSDYSQQLHRTLAVASRREKGKMIYGSRGSVRCEPEHVVSVPPVPLDFRDHVSSVTSRTSVTLYVLINAGAGAVVLVAVRASRVLTGTGPSSG